MNKASSIPDRMELSLQGRLCGGGQRKNMQLLIPQIFHPVFILVVTEGRTQDAGGMFYGISGPITLP